MPISNFRHLGVFQAITYRKIASIVSQPISPVDALTTSASAQENSRYAATISMHT